MCEKIGFLKQLRYSITTGLNKKGETIKVSTLFSAFGKEICSLYHYLAVPGEDRKKLDSIIKSLLEHFLLCINEINEIFVFNEAVPEQYESVNMYVN